MSIYLSHASLFEYYQSPDASSDQNAELSAIPADHRPSVSAAEEAYIQRLFSARMPFACSVRNQGKRLDNPRIITHVQDAHLPNQLFRHLGRGIFIAPPELCMLQLAQRLSLGSLMMAYYEFFGAYRIDFEGSFGYTSRKPLSTWENAMRFVREAKGASGASMMERALRGMAQGSAASPPEAQIACFFVPPCKIGGAGFSGARLNFPIRTEKTLRYADVCWPEHKLILEYDSNQEHASSEKINRDAIRRNELLAAGWTVITITSKQLYSLTSMKELIPVIAKHLGRNFRPRTKEYLLKQQKLYNKIIAPMTHREICDVLRQKRFRSPNKKRSSDEPSASSPLEP